MAIPKSIHRTDPLPALANAGKDRAIRDFVAAWRDATEAPTADPCRRFMQIGTFAKNRSAN